MANRRFIDFPIAASVGNNDIVLIWQDGLNKQTTKATLLQGSPQSLAGLTDVDIAGLINGQILQYNSTTSKWENVDRTDINLSQLGDVTIVAPANGQVLVYNSSTSKWENSSGGYVPYTGAVTTVNLGAQSILAGSFVKAGGTAAQFLKANGSVDSTAYGTGTVTSVALTMPTAFSVAGSPITTAGTLAVTATGTTAQYIRGDGSLATFPGLTGFVPYTGATADVNLGTHDLAAERGTFTNNGSSDTLTVNHTSGSGYGIIVTKGGSNEALYVSKTSGSGNAMTVVGGRTSLVDLALSSVTNTAGDFLTLSGGVVHKRTAAEVRTDIGAGTVTSVGLSSATSGVTIGSTPITTSGTITLAIATASGSQNGLLSSTDWTTFNNKASTADLANYLPLAGGTMSGQLISSFNTGGEPFVNAIFRGIGGSNIGGILTNGTTQAHIRFLVGSNTWDGAGAKQWQIRVGNGNSEDNLKIYSWTYGNDVATFLADATVRLHKYTTNGFVKFGSSNGTLEVDTNVYYLASNPSGFTSNTGTVTSVGLSSATSGVTIGSTPVTTSGTITLAIATASGSQNGLLSSTDWATFNGKQNALTNPVTGTGTTDYLPKFTGSTTIGNSNLINTTAGNLGLEVTPSSWASGARAFQIGARMSLYNDGFNNALFANNMFYNGSDNIYINTAAVGRFYIEHTGAFIWNQAPSGTAGTSVSFTAPMTLFASGNLLVGTGSDAGFKLDVNGTGRFSGALTGTSAIFSSSVTAGGTNYLVNTSTGTNAVYQRILNTGGDLILGLNSSAGNSLAAGGLAYATSIYNNTNTAMQFGTNAVFNMTIAAGGNVGIGLNNPSALLHISGPNKDVSGSYYSQLKINGTGTYPDNIAGLSFENSGVQQHIRFVESGVTKLQIRYNAGNTIDNRLKYYSFITGTDFITFNGNNGNVLIGTDTDPGYKLRVNGTTFTNDIRTFLPEADSVSTPWRFGTASIASITPNRRLRVNVGGVEYYIGAVEV